MRKGDAGGEGGGGWGEAETTPRRHDGRLQCRRPPEWEGGGWEGAVGEGGRDKTYLPN